MRLNLTATFALLATAAFSQTPPPRQQDRRPAMAETPNTDLYYQLAPDASPQEGVPKGEIRGPFVLPSEAYPGTQHTYWVYVPAQYDASTPASLMIFQDGQAFMAPEGDLRAQNVMDNLIYRREIPVMIGVFINPGRRPDQVEPSPQTSWGDGTTNRGIEYNTPDDKYARVITEELMPALYKEYNISKDPEQQPRPPRRRLRREARLVLPERPPHEGPHAERLRRELLLEHEPPRAKIR